MERFTFSGMNKEYQAERNAYLQKQAASIGQRPEDLNAHLTAREWGFETGLRHFCGVKEEAIMLAKRAYVEQLERLRSRLEFLAGVADSVVKSRKQ